MPDLISFILVTVIIMLTVILVVFSVQIFFILRDFHKSLRNLNKILVNLEHISTKIDETVSSATLVSLGAKIISSLVSLIRKNGEK